MNSSEDIKTFEERLGAEPRDTAASVRAEGGDASPERLAAVTEAEALEDRIEATLRAPEPPTDLLEGLLAIPENAPARKGLPSWLALAASLFFLVGLSGLVWLGVKPGSASVAEYVEAHYHHDGEAVLARATDGSDPAQVEAVLASLGARATADFAGRVQFIKFCPTPESQGAHMVLSTADGPATVIFMPAVNLEEPLVIRFDGVEAEVIGLESGAAAIIGAGDDSARELRASLEAGILPMSADA